MHHYTLFLDESGAFRERNLFGAADARGASQLVGILGPTRSLSKQACEDVLQRAYTAVGRALPAEVHGNKESGGDRYDRLLEALIGQLSQTDWQAVRLVNNAGLGYGGEIGTYTNMVAELVARLFEHLGRHDLAGTLELCCAERTARGVFMKRREYEQRLAEYLGRARARRGGDSRSAKWELGGVRLAPGLHARELQICDLLSNASFRNYSKCGEQVRARLAELFGDCNFALSEVDAIQRAEDLQRHGALGLGLQVLAEWLSTSKPSDTVRPALSACLDGIVESLAELPTPLRDPHLLLTVSWLEQLVEGLRDPVRCAFVVGWLLQRVEAPLRARLGGEAVTLDWWAFSLQRQALTAANHSGALTAAAAASRALQELEPCIAGRQEHLHLLIDSRLHQAVHHTDTLAPESAAQSLEPLHQYFSALDLLHEALPSVVAPTVRSRRKGELLGTQLQAEMYAGLRDPSRLARARELNQLARREFSNEADQARQLQYRAQIETFAGQFAEARAHLARSLGLEQSDHASIAERIQGLSGFPQGFALLHWLRLGARALLDADVEGVAFAKAFASVSWDQVSWRSEQNVAFPAHGVQRYWAVTCAALPGGRDRALSGLRQLRRLEATGVLELIGLAAQLEVAGLLWTEARGTAQALLDSTVQHRSGALQLLHQLKAGELVNHPGIARLLGEWRATVEQIVAGEIAERSVRTVLLGAGRLLGT